MKRYGFGVDVGGTSIKMGLFCEQGELLKKWEIPTNIQFGGKHILPDIVREITATLEEHNISEESVLGIGIGVPGPVTDTAIVNGCVNLGWKEKDIVKEMQELTQITVKVANDANVATLGEMWKGSAQSVADVIMITLGTGIGAGIVSGGNLINGFHGTGGEIGHICVKEDETEPCNYGKYGCLEQYASATGIVRMAKRKLAESSKKTKLSQIERLSAKDIFDKAQVGDVLAGEIVEETGRILGMVLSNIACVTNPEMIVVGGGVSKAGEILRETIEKYFKEMAFGPCKETKFKLAILGNDAGIYGAMKLVMNN